MHSNPRVTKSDEKSRFSDLCLWSSASFPRSHTSARRPAADHPFPTFPVRHTGASAVRRHAISQHWRSSAPPLRSLRPTTLSKKNIIITIIYTNDLPITLTIIIIIYINDIPITLTIIIITSLLCHCYDTVTFMVPSLHHHKNAITSSWRHQSSSCHHYIIITTPLCHSVIMTSSFIIVSSLHHHNNTVTSLCHRK